jgi:hypothetical protein
MALGGSNVRCALCGKAVDLNSPLFRATGDFLPPRDPLARFCNVPMHWTCYSAWPERPTFARSYVAAWMGANRANPFWWSVYKDERVYVSVNPERPVEEASVRLSAVGTDIRIPLPRWADWLANPQRVTPALSALEVAELAVVLRVLRAHYPDDHALVDAIDPDEKRSRPGRPPPEHAPRNPRSAAGPQSNC